jgi:hypothetical protein
MKHEKKYQHKACLQCKSNAPSSGANRQSLLFNMGGIRPFFSGVVRLAFNLHGGVGANHWHPCHPHIPHIVPIQGTLTPPVF